VSTERLGGDGRYKTSVSPDARMAAGDRPARKVWVDSGPAGTRDPGERLIAFVADRWYYSIARHPTVLQGRSTLAMSDVMDLALPPPPLGMKTYMDGFEGSDLIGVYYALDLLSEVVEGEPVEVIGDGQVFEFLAGFGKVSARYAGRDWAPEMREHIRDAEARFPKVVYRTIASPQNRAGQLVDQMKRRNQALDGQVWIGYDSRG
jgi:hypothetical protein